MNRAAATRRTAIVPDPRPLPNPLLPVLPFDCRWLPVPLRPWVEDISERMQVPPEFVATPAMIAAGSLIGRKVAIRPLQHDNWQEVPNLWGGIVGRPGTLKSPAIKRALEPLSRLEACANEDYQWAIKEWEQASDVRSARSDARKAHLKKRLSTDLDADLSDLIDANEDEEEPFPRRYKANDTTYQALGELLRQNQNGLLVHRDELMALLRALDRDDQAEARGFYLTGWNGAEPYVFDRIGRGTNLVIPAVTISMLGSTQPSALQTYVRGVVDGTSLDDGLLQRFSMLVWPDMPANWEQHDRLPNELYRRAAFTTFERLDRLTADTIGASDDDPERPNPYLRFDPIGYEGFKMWHRDLEARLRVGDMLPALESHLAKYRKLVPALALVHHLASGGTGPVSGGSLMAALGWASYLESHAQRIYSAGAAGAIDGAKVILRNLRNGRLQAPFTARDIQRRGWAALGSDAKKVESALDLLVEYGWLFETEVPTGPKGGRPSWEYTPHPLAISG